MPKTNEAKIEPEVAPMPEITIESKEEPTKTPIIKSKRWLRYDFKQNEIVDQSKALAQNIERVATLDSELDSIKATYKAKIGSAESHITLLSQAVNKGYEMRDIECITEMHAPKNGWKTTSRVDTGEIVETEKMDAHEMQEQLPLGGDADDDDDDGSESEGE